MASQENGGGVKLYIHVDRLILDRAAGQMVDRNRLAETIQTEVAGCIATGGLPLQMQSSSMRPYAWGSRRESHATGAGIGGALWESLNR
jgi:hypothetical protein